MTGVTAERFQYRVGHGGFHATIVNAPAGRLTYVYDVGAHPSKPLLLDAIAAFVDHLGSSSVTKVDFIVLSHIDQDHVNGLSELLDALNCAAITVDTVILPWLSSVEKLFALARNSHRGPGTAVAQLAGTGSDADSYLRDRGVENVVRVGSPSQDGPADGAFGQQQAVPRIIASGTSLPTPSSAVWTLVPIKLEPSEDALDLFRSEITKSTGLDPNDVAMHEQLLRRHRPAIRAAMRVASGAVSGVSSKEITNWSSVALYGGGTATIAACTIAPTRTDIHLSCVHGWLHTGDLPLAAASVWAEISRQLSAASVVLPVCVLVAPHHGSQLSHQPALFRLARPGNVVLTTGRTRGGRVAKGINSAQALAGAARSGANVFDLHN